MAYNRFDNNCKNIILYVFEARRAFDVVNENILSQDSNVTLDKYEFPLKIIMIFPFQQIETNLWVFFDVAPDDIAVLLLLHDKMHHKTLQCIQFNKVSILIAV